MVFLNFLIFISKTNVQDILSKEDIGTGVEVYKIIEDWFNCNSRIRANVNKNPQGSHGELLTKWLAENYKLFTEMSNDERDAGTLEQSGFMRNHKCYVYALQVLR